MQWGRNHVNCKSFSEKATSSSSLRSTRLSLSAVLYSVFMYTTVRPRLHGDFALALTRCSCSALREVAVFVRQCGKCKPLYASVIERCVILPVGTWSAAREQSFRFDGGHVHNVTTSHFEQKETKTKFVSNKTAIYRRNRSSVCLLFVKLALLCVFSLFIRPITYTRASREHALDASGSSKPELQQRRQ